MDSIYIDIFLCTLIGFFSFKGLNRGFVSESKGIAALVIAFLTFHKYAPITKDYINEYIKISPSSIDNVSIFVTFILIMIAVYVFAFFIDVFLLRNGALDFYNKIAGMLFSFAQIVLILSVIMYSVSVFVQIDDDKQDWLNNSKTYQYLKEIGFKLTGEYINKDTDIIDSMINNILSLDSVQDVDTQNLINDQVEEVLDGLKNGENLEKLKDTYLK